MARMSRINGGLQLLTRQEVISLERGDALVSPVVHGRARVGGAVQLVKLQCEGAFAFEIRAGDVDLRARPRSIVNLLFQRQVSVGIDAASCADARDSSGEIKPRKADGHLMEDAAA